MDCSISDFSVLHGLPEFAQIHGHWVGDAIQPSHPLPPPSPPAFNPPQHQGLFQWVTLRIRRPKYWSLSSASVLPMNIQDWFPLRLTSLISWSPRDSQESSLAPQFESIISTVLSLLYYLTFTVYVLWYPWQIYARPLKLQDITTKQMQDDIVDFDVFWYLGFLCPV